MLVTALSLMIAIKGNKFEFFGVKVEFNTASWTVTVFGDNEVCNVLAIGLWVVIIFAV